MISLSHLHAPKRKHEFNSELEKDVWTACYNFIIIFLIFDVQSTFYKICITCLTFKVQIKHLFYKCNYTNICQLTNELFYPLIMQHRGNKTNFQSIYWGFSQFTMGMSETGGHRDSWMGKELLFYELNLVTFLFICWSSVLWKQLTHPY